MKAHNFKFCKINKQKVRKLKDKISFNCKSDRK